MVFSSFLSHSMHTRRRVFNVGAFGGFPGLFPSVHHPITQSRGNAAPSRRNGPRVRCVKRVVPEAKLRETEEGLVPEGEGWFVLNARDARWFETDELGSATIFEGEPRFRDLGFHLEVLQPGQPNCMYHAESNQEDFLVLAGECIAVIEGEERRLSAWDFVHCPPMTEHVFVAAGEGPCVMVMVGSRDPGRDIVYPVNEVAARHGASVETETTEPSDAYARFQRPRPVRYPEGRLPGR
jgi:uncharacterized cupin superfamily protein